VAKGRFWGAAAEITLAHRPLLLRLLVSVGWWLLEKNRPIVGDSGRNCVEVKSHKFSLKSRAKIFDGSLVGL
jgi:hypothetical protein